MGKAQTKEALKNKPDIEAIMARIREEVRAGIAADDSTLAALKPSDSSLRKSTSTSPLLYSEELNYLNSHWNDWNTSPDITSHRKFIGPVIIRAKRFFVNIAWKYLLKDYFERERQFQMNLVRYLNSTARYVDARDKEIFWEIINKVDNDVRGLNERMDQLYDEASATTRSVQLDLHERLCQLEGERQRLSHLLDHLRVEVGQSDNVVRGFERSLAVLSRGTHGAAGNEPVAGKTLVPLQDGIDYLLLENRYRGSEEDIKERQRDYVPHFKQAGGKIIEIGSGRGEFLELLKENGIDAQGIDIDEAMIRRCQAKGLDVLLKDGLQFLAELEDHSIGGLFAAQVVEHLTREQLAMLFELAVRKVKPGGKIIFETINSDSVTALARNYFRDPTHVWPLQPDTLRYMMEMKGIQVDAVNYRSPYPKEAMLQPVEISNHLPARWQVTLQALNDNVTRLNSLLFGYQDYCIIGTPPNI